MEEIIDEQDPFMEQEPLTISLVLLEHNTI